MSFSKSDTQLQRPPVRFQPMLMAIIAGAVAVVGIVTLVVSHASTQSTFSNAYLSVTPTSVGVIASRKTPNITLMQADHSGYTDGLIYDKGFTITNKTATAFELVSTSPTQGVGFYESSGGMQAGQTLKIHTYINPSKPNGVYTGSAVLKYFANDLQQWVSGPTMSYSITLVNYYYTDYLTASSLTQSATLSRKAVDPASGLVFAAGPGLTSVGAGGFQIYNNQPTQGVGYYETSGGMVTGQTTPVRLYINPSKPDGVYTSTATLKYYAPDLKAWLDGPTLTYTINLVSTYYTDYLTLNETTVNVTLSRAKTDVSSGLIYGTGPTITNKTSGGFQVKYDHPTQGVGFYESSGGLQPGQKLTLRTYINPAKPNGTYTGSAVLQYLDKTTQVWTNGPRIYYNLKLTN